MENSASRMWRFGQSDYNVLIDVENATLTVKVEETLSADAWQGSFESKQLEELTKKTGNYKQFNVFVSMLNAAITRSSESVSLDLLTYADLEALRNHKLGHSSRQGSSPGAKPGWTQLNSKRYLILTYNVEFDRIHYPLALTYAGKPDPAVLQETIRRLRSELEKQSQKGGKVKHSDLQRLQDEYDILLQEKEEIEELFEAFKSDVMTSRNGTAAKQIKILKQAVRNLDQELSKEKIKHQKYVQRKNKEIRDLLEELDDLKASDRNLKIRLRSVTNELAVLKQGGMYSSRQPATNRGRTRTSSTEKNICKQLPSSASKYKMRTPSPSGARFPRFDPTAYVQEKTRRQRESNLKSRSGSRLGMRSRSNSTERLDYRKPPRSSPSTSTTRLSGAGIAAFKSRSRTSSVGSNASSRGSSRRPSLTRSDSDNSLTQLQGGRKKGPLQQRSGRQPGGRNVKQAWGSRQTPVSTPELMKRVTKGKSLDSSHEILDKSVELTEIDARLSALQEFMKKSLASRTQTGIA